MFWETVTLIKTSKNLFEAHFKALSEVNKEPRTFPWLSPYQERRAVFLLLALLLSQGMRAPLSGLPALFNGSSCLFVSHMCIKWPQTKWLKTTHTHTYLTVSIGQKSRHSIIGSSRQGLISLKSGCWWN